MDNSGDVTVPSLGGLVGDGRGTRTGGGMGCCTGKGRDTLLIALVSISVWIVDVVIAGISWRIATTLGFHASESPKRFIISYVKRSQDKVGIRRIRSWIHGKAGPVKASMATLTRLSSGILDTRKYCSARASHAIALEPSNVGIVIGGVPPEIFMLEPCPLDETLGNEPVVLFGFP